VEFQRVQYTVKTTSGGEPTVKPRDRHIYNLKHNHTVPGGLQSWPSESPNFFIQSVSSTTKEVGTLGLKRSRFPGRKQWKALPVDLSGKHSKNDYGLPTFVKNAEPLFEINHKEAVYEWTDGEGKAVAVEDEGEDTHRLIVTASLPRKTLDALVALWCCRMWQHSADNTESIYGGREACKHTQGGDREILNFSNGMEHSTEKAEPIEGAPRSWIQVVGLILSTPSQSSRQPAKAFDLVHSTCPVMQKNVFRNQTILSRNSENHRLGVTRELRAMPLGAHGSGIGSKRDPKLTAGQISASCIVCRQCDVGQS
jgi:hypothetical protein